LIIRPNSEERNGSQPPDGKASNTGRVMIVDDHDLFRQALALVLERYADFEVCAQAASLPEARRALRAHHDGIDLVILDLDLPNGGGDELIHELVGIESDIPVLALTARQDLAAGAWRTGEVLTTASSVDEIVGVARQLVG
jgi:CheY-like chemotaxis protein